MKKTKFKRLVENQIIGWRSILSAAFTFIAVVAISAAGLMFALWVVAMYPITSICVAALLMLAGMAHVVGEDIQKKRERRAKRGFGNGC